MGNYIYKVNTSTVIAAHNTTTGEDINIVTAAYWFKDGSSTDWDKIRVKAERVEKRIENSGVDISRVVFSTKLKSLVHGNTVYRYKGQAMYNDTPDYTSEGAIGWIWKEGNQWFYKDVTKEQLMKEIRKSPNYNY